MSGALAIASVTAVLKDLLDNAMIDHSVSTTVSGPVKVTALAPDRITTGEEESAQLNLFLYHITPNPGWRNIGLPSRDERGTRLTNPPLALDLYYLLTAYGKQDFEAEILLGYAAQLLHETSILTRKAISKALEPSPVSGVILPPILGALAASDLADQAELIKISPHITTTEEISKLWTAFQAKYRPSIVYHVSVVLIESKYPVRLPLPVLSRGKPTDDGRDEGVVVQPNIVQPNIMGPVSPDPILQEVILPNQQPAIRMGETLILSGFNLDGAVTARFTRAGLSDTLELQISEGTSTECKVQIPSDLANDQAPQNSQLNPQCWQVGIYSVAVVINREDQPDLITNELPVALAPHIIKSTSNIIGNVMTLTVKCSPQVRMTQQVKLIVSDSPPIAADPIMQDTDILTFKSSSLPPGKYPLRLRVDGIDSILIDRSKHPPIFDSILEVGI